MRPSHKKTPDREYAALRRVWYKKLRDKGFHDIENPENPDGLLSRYTCTNRAFTPEYFEWARRCMATRFKSRKQRRVWDLHSQGFTEMEIAKKTKIPLGTIAYWVSNLRKELLKKVV